MVDDTMVENSADVGGGGVATDAGETSITDSTFEGNIDNHAGFGGAAVLVNGGGILNLAGTLLAKAAGAGECSNAGGSIVDGGYNLSDDSSCAFSGTSGNGDIDQFLGGIANNGGPVATVAELKGAPSIDVVPATAVDVNNLALCAGTDARGVPRPQTGCDIGSFQTISTTTTISTSSDDITKGSPVTFTATVTPSVAPQALGGSVKFYRSDGGQAVLLNTELLNGSSPDQSILTTTSLPVGVWTITAVYEGATGFASSSTATGVTVTVTH
jgi:hypothetical protein